VAQAIEHLLYKCEALSSNSNSTKKEKKLNINLPYRTGRVVQVVQLLPSKLEALSSNSSTRKKNTNLPYSPAILLLGMYPREMMTYTHIPAKL
jgi:hypothetical protein